MITVAKGKFEGTQEELQARVDDFKAAKQAHAFTVGVPAPREDDLIEALAASEEPFQIEVEPQPEAPTPEQVEAAEFAAKRAAAVRDFLEMQLDAVAQQVDAPQSIKDYAAAKAVKG